MLAVYANAGLAWLVLAWGFVPAIIAAAYRGQSVAALNRVFQNRAAKHPVEHYLDLWNAFAVAVLIAGTCQLLSMLWLSRLEDARSRRWLGLFAALFLGVTVVSGPRHDYVADLEIWDAVRQGDDPWWLVAGRGSPLNAYGPLFNVLAPLAQVNPLAPKLAFAMTYVAFVACLIRARRGVSTAAALVWLVNPLPWVEIAYFGHFDVLVALACVLAVRLRVQGRDAASGASLAAGILLKYVPLVILPFLVVDDRRARPRVLVSAVALIALGMLISVYLWGASTLRPLTFAATRGSNLLSIFRYLRGVYSPSRWFGLEMNLDRFSLPGLAVAGVTVFAWCVFRRVAPGRGAVLAVLTTLLFYQVGFVQYQMILFFLVSSWLVFDAGAALLSGWRKASLAAYFGWLAVFDLWYASIGGVIHPEDSFARVEDVVGLPTFVLGCLLLAALLTVQDRNTCDVPARPG